MEAEVKSLRRAEIRLPGSELTSSHSCPWEELGGSSTLVCCWWHTPSTRSPVYNGYRSRQAPSEFLFLSSELKSLLSTQASIDPWPLYLVPSWLQEDSLSCPGLVYISLVQGGGRVGVVILMYGLGPHWFSLQYGSVTQLCPTPCDPMNCRTPGFPVHHQLPEPTQIPVHHTWWCHPTISSSVVPFFSHRQSFPASGSFRMSALCIRWPKDWSFTLSISPSNEYSGLISFRMDCLDLLAVQGTLKSSPTPQFKSISSSTLSFLNSPTFTSIHNYWKNHSFD